MPTYSREITLLALQIESLAKHCPESLIKKYNVIWTGGDLAENKSKILEILDRSKLSIAFEIIDSRDLYSESVPGGGWKYQQLVKLLGCDLVTTDFYWVLDTKNFFIRNLELTDLFDETGRARSYLQKVGPALKEYLSQTLSYFGVSNTLLDLPVMQTATPFMFNTALARDLVSTKNFLNDFVNIYKLTEFYSYFAYGYSQDRLESIYSYSEPICSTFFSGPQDTSVQYIKNCMARTSVYQTKMLGVHRNAYIETCDNYFFNWLADVLVNAELCVNTDTAIDRISTIKLSLMGE